MIVDVDLSSHPAAITLVDPDDVKGFSMRVRGGRDRAHLAAAVEAVAAGRLDGDHVWVSEAWLRDQAQGRVPDGWDASFAGMLEFARSKGWLADDGAIRAHVEEVPNDS